MRRRFFNNNIGYFDINDYLTIEALEDNLQIYFPYEDLMYGIDGVGWKKLVAGVYSPAISKGQTISFKGNVNSTVVNIKSFTITKRCNLLGNCMSLALNNVPHFCGLFKDCTTIVYIYKDFLPATTLADYCYYSMFNGCTSLTTTPELPATILASNCYEVMFNGCTSLTTAPTLPATTLADYCYYSMFNGCTSLTTTPELPATTLAQGCYQGMFYACKALTTAFELPATTLVNYCYSNMFHNCTNLNHIKMLATDVSARDCLSHWVEGVAPTGTFVKHPDMTTLPTGTSGIPEGWTVVNDGEESGGGLEFPITLSQLTGTITEYPEVAEYLLNSYNVPVGYTATDDMVNIVDDIYVETFGGNVDGKVIAISKSDDGNSLFLWTEKAINDIKVARLVAPSYYLGVVAWD